MSDRPDDLAPLLEELAETLEALQRAQRPRGLSELLRFTEQYTIPAVIAVLEANIRLLELLAGTIRLAEGRVDRGRGDREGRGRGAEALSRSARETLDAALADLTRAFEGEPSDPESRRLLEEARELRAEVRERLAAAETAPEDGSDSEPITIDVDAELASIREEVDGDHPDGNDSADDVPGDDDSPGR
ncbi:DUF7547 family protein [Natronomonas sp. EA1]|uniref:DUF7547 family protein n=1 Tax=Natronomonas sp. EA1 TaxID=3421655 RepID=UPI003EBED0DC